MIAFLYTNNGLSEKGNQKTISFIITSKRTKCSGINLTKQVKEESTENYKTLTKEIKEDTHK